MNRFNIDPSGINPFNMDPFDIDNFDENDILSPFNNIAVPPNNHVLPKMVIAYSLLTGVYVFTGSCNVLDPRIYRLRQTLSVIMIISTILLFYAFGNAILEYYRRQQFIEMENEEYRLNALYHENFNDDHLRFDDSDDSDGDYHDSSDIERNYDDFIDNEQEEYFHNEEDHGEYFLSEEDHDEYFLNEEDHDEYFLNELDLEQLARNEPSNEGFSHYMHGWDCRCISCNRNVDP